MYQEYQDKSILLNLIILLLFEDNIVKLNLQNTVYTMHSIMTLRENSEYHLKVPGIYIRYIFLNHMNVVLYCTLKASCKKVIYSKVRVLHSSILYII